AFPRRRWTALLWGAFAGAVRAYGGVRGPYPPWRPPGRVADSAADEVRARDQPQDGEGPGPNDSALAPVAGGSGNRMRSRPSRQNVEGWLRRKTAPAPPLPKQGIVRLTPKPFRSPLVAPEPMVAYSCGVVRGRRDCLPSCGIARSGGYAGWIRASGTSTRL